MLLFAFIALAVAGMVNALLFPVFFGLMAARTASGSSLDIFGYLLWLTMAVVFATVYWAPNRAWSRWG